MRGMGLEEQAIEELADRVRKRVRGEWRAGTPSWPTVQLNTIPHVMSLMRDAGVVIADDLEFRRFCTVPRKFIERERRFALLATRNKDAARFAAVVTPRIRRDRTHLQPAGYVAADVHHLDILFRRGDGSVVTPKAVAWMDLATNRARLDFFIMPKGEMIRREHVIQSSLRCAATRVGEFRPGSTRTTGAPLQPARKGDRGPLLNSGAGCLRTVAGVDRRQCMKKKTANQGREPAPFPGDEERLNTGLRTALDYYHTKPQAGHLAGMLPDQCFARFVDAGWAATIIDPWQLAIAFSTEMVKPVRAGGTLRLDRQDFRADELQAWVGHRVLVRKPLFGNREMLFVFSEFGEPIAVALPDTAYAFGDPRGAGEQARRGKAPSCDLKQTAAQSDPTAGGEPAMAEVVRLLGHRARPPNPAAVVRINPEFSQAAQMAKRSTRTAGEIDRKHQELNRKTDFLKRLTANG